MTGDHYTNNCPKKKKNEPSRSITPYPRCRRGGRQSRGRDLQNDEGILWMQTVG